MSPQLILMDIGVFVLAFLFFVYKVRSDKARKSGIASLRKKHRAHNMYVRYSRNFLTRNRFRRIVTQLSTLSCHTKEELEFVSVSTFEHAMIISMSMPLIAAITMRDVISVVLVAFVAYIYYDITVDKVYDKLYRGILDEISICLQSIKERYMESDSIPTALLRSDKGKYLGRPVGMIYDMVASVNSADILEEFLRTSPMRILKTLAITCYIMSDTGDDKEIDGNSPFLGAMDVLIQECDSDILRLLSMKIAFSSLDKLALVGIALIPIFEWFLVTKMPGTAVLIKGIYGLTVKIVIIVITMLAYYIISVINRPSVVNQVDINADVDKLAKHYKMRPVLSTIVPKEFKTLEKIDQMLYDSLSSKTLNYIYTSKIIGSISLFLITIVLFTAGTATARSYMWDNTKTLSLVPDPPIEQRIFNQLKKADREFMLKPEKLSAEDTRKFLKSKVMGLNDFLIDKQVQRLQSKWDYYYVKLRFKWWMILVAYLAGVGGWFLPEFSLKLRRWLVRFEAEDDVMQLQNLMIVLATTKMNPMKALFWLEKQSTIHKNMLRFAYHEYNSDPEGALIRLKFKATLPPLKRLVSNLQMAAYNLTLTQAFVGMKGAKAQSLAKREKLMEESINSRKEIAKIISTLPAGIALFLMFMLPILLFGIMEFMGVQNKM